MRRNLSDLAKTSGPTKDTDAITEGTTYQKQDTRTVLTLTVRFTDIPPRSQRLIQTHKLAIALHRPNVYLFPYVDKAGLVTRNAEEPTTVLVTSLSVVTLAINP